jgi:hypothetical protein
MKNEVHSMEDDMGNRRPLKPFKPLAEMELDELRWYAAQLRHQCYGYVWDGDGKV